MSDDFNSVNTEYDRQQNWIKDQMKSVSPTTDGRKFDGGKLEYGLLPPLALKATVMC